jgi:hypothetical protein
VSVCAVNGCGKPAAHDHHLRPNSLLPNNVTVPLCEEHHAFAHNRRYSPHEADHRTLTVIGLDRKRASGRQPNGTPRYGFHWVDGHVVENPAEQDILRAMAQMASDGVPIADAAERLNAEGHRMRNGQPWNGHNVGRRCVDAGIYRKGPYGKREAA